MVTHETKIKILIKKILSKEDKLFLYKKIPEEEELVCFYLEIWLLFIEIGEEKKIPSFIEFMNFNDFNKIFKEVIASFEKGCRNLNEIKKISNI